MRRLSRREFLIQSGRVSLAAGMAVPLWSGCWGQGVDETSGLYDVIVVGGGAAGAIVAAKLQGAAGGGKRILVIEAGGPTSAAIGGTAYPPWLPAGRRDLTMFDGTRSRPVDHAAGSNEGARAPRSDASQAAVM